MQPFRRLADGTVQFLSLPRRSAGHAYDINIQRQVVGLVETYNSSGGYTGMYGVLWQADGTRKDLNTFIGGSGWHGIPSARAISDGGIIAAVGTRNAGEELRPLLMIPN